MHDGASPRRRDGFSGGRDEESFGSSAASQRADELGDIRQHSDSSETVHADVCHDSAGNELIEGFKGLSVQLTKAGMSLLRVLATIGALGLLGGGMLFVLSKDDVSSRKVDRSTCGGCACWDTLSKAPYAAAGYRYVYHNMEIETLLLFGMIVLACNALERTLAHAMSIVAKRRLALPAAAASLLSVVSVAVSFGAMWHYVNDNDDTTNRMIPTQAYFLVSELLSCFCIVQCLATTLRRPQTEGNTSKTCIDKDIGVSAASRALCGWVVLCNSLCHVYLSGSDQVVHDLLFNKSASVQQVVRGNFFAVTDVGMAAWAAYEVGMFGACCCAPRRGTFQWATLAGCIGVAAAVCFWYKTFLPQV